MKRYTPFQELLRYVEGEIFDLALDQQLNSSEDRNYDFVLGYRCALNLVLEKAYTIYNRRFPAEFLALDERTEEASLRLLAALKKRD